MGAKDPASTAGGQQNEYLQRAYALNGVDAARDLYNEWAEAYDADLLKHDYLSPQAAVQALDLHWPATTQETTEGTLYVLDAGCGTGLVGVYLRQLVVERKDVQLFLDGVDLTPGMLAVARQKGFYRDLWSADLNHKLDVVDHKYDVVFCVGTLTKGHVGPKCLEEFVRVTKRGGIVIATVHDEIWETHGYKAEAERLGGHGMVTVLSTAEFGIVKGETSGGRMVILQRT